MLAAAAVLLLVSAVGKLARLWASATSCTHTQVTLQGAALMVVAKFLVAWFQRLNEESQGRLAEAHFDDPLSLKPVRQLLAARSCTHVGS